MSVVKLEAIDNSIDAASLTESNDIVLLIPDFHAEKVWLDLDRSSCICLLTAP
jgi:hypothetical protein